VENILREWHVTMILSSIFTSFAIFIATVSTLNVTELALFVKVIDALAAIVTLPTISAIHICGSFKELAVNFFVKQHHAHISVDYTVLSWEWWNDIDRVPFILILEHIIINKGEDRLSALYTRGFHDCLKAAVPERFLWFQ